jgi:hypothetical protein
LVLVIVTAVVVEVEIVLAVAAVVFFVTCSAVEPTYTPDEDWKP